MAKSDTRYPAIVFAIVAFALALRVIVGRASAADSDVGR